jgi:hypothetical protein
MPSAITPFQVGAALCVIRIVDIGGTDGPTMDRAFHHLATEGRFPRPDLNSAYRLLLNAGLLLVDGAWTTHHESVLVLLSLPDETALPLLEALLAPPSELEDELADALRRAEIGALGEEAVAAWCVEELTELRHVDLAEQVRRVSLVSDRFGYDVTAPVLAGSPRMLEVKASTSASNSKTFRFYVTRHEYEIGRKHPKQWALVACAVRDDEVSILGWCRASEFERYLPDDGNGRWTEALVNLPTSALFPEAPSAV